MRQALLATALVLAVPLAGCLQPVDLPTGTDTSVIVTGDIGQSPGLDASNPGPDAYTDWPDAATGIDTAVAGPDASNPGPDASNPGPDASAVTCKLDPDCPPPVQTDPICNPLKARCDKGSCVNERIPRVWDNKPGACNLPAECDCQNLSHSKCAGAYVCALNQCQWECGGCQSDLECVFGQICEETNCGAPKQCVDGCRDSTNCSGGKVCGDFVAPFCGEPYGVCVDGSACTVEKDCPVGTACDYTGLCIPGCHTNENCPPGEVCPPLMCPDGQFSCVGQCQSGTACVLDSDCKVAGEVCGTTWDNCNKHCLPGCHDSTQCPADQQCQAYYCTGGPGCGCDTFTCTPRPVGCTLDTDCVKGTVCAFDDVMGCSGAKHCVNGCFTNDECDTGFECSPSYCGPSTCCPGGCTPKAQDCQLDQDCKDGEICTYDDHFGCSGKMTCQPGCRPDSSGGPGTCKLGEICELGRCGKCCPGTCVTPPSCNTDDECGFGYVCELQAGCVGPKTCIPGCHNADKCNPGQICNTPKCLGCPCPGFCADQVCKSESDCPVGSACDYDGNGLEKTCQVGCHIPANCPGNAQCLQTPCTPCPPGQHCACLGVCEVGCSTGQKSCTSTMDCGSWGSSYCQSAMTNAGGCCQMCPIYDMPPCMDPNQCIYGGDVGPDGCVQGMKCATCTGCSNLDPQVCGINYQTYGCAAVAKAVGVEVLHTGACLPYEGMDCLWSNGYCPKGEYCRDECPNCAMDQTRCTQTGSCFNSWDCPAPPGCSAGCDSASHQCYTMCP